MRHVYISYHRDDRDFVTRLINQIEDAGFRVWSDDERLRADNTAWHASIDDAIRDAFVMLAVITPAARQSEQVNYEWTFALGSDIPVISIVLKPSNLHPRQQSLDSLDFVDQQCQPWGKLLGLIREAEDERVDQDAELSPAHDENARFRSLPPHFEPSEDQLPEHLPPMERMRQSQRSRDDMPLFRSMRNGHPPIDRLLQALEGDDRERRARAAYQLGQSGDRSTIPALIKTLRDDDWRVREAAATALARLKAAGAVPAMLETLRQARSGPFGNSSQTKTILQAIRDIGPSSLPVLIDALSDEEPRIRHMIVDLLGEIGDADAVPALAGTLHDPEARVRWRAADALGRMGDESAVTDLLVMLRDQDKEARIAAAWALGQIGHPSAIGGLITMLHDREWRTRWAAVQALWEIGESAIPALIETLSDQDEYVRNAAIRAIAEIGTAAVEPLIDTLGGRDWDLRWTAAAALQELGDVAVEPLVAALNTLEWQAAWAAAETLKRIGTKDALQAVSLWLEANSADAQEFATSLPAPQPSNEADTNADTNG